MRCDTYIRQDVLLLQDTNTLMLQRMLCSFFFVLSFFLVFHLRANFALDASWKQVRYIFADMQNALNPQLSILFWKSDLR